MRSSSRPHLSVALFAILLISLAVAPAAEARSRVLARTSTSATPRMIMPGAESKHAAASRVPLRIRRTSFVSATVRRDGKIVRRMKPRSLRPGRRSIRWNGLTDQGVAADPGAYTIRVAMRDRTRRWQIVTASVQVHALLTEPLTLQWPIAGAVTSGYGMRGGRMHQGVDVPAPSGTPIVAAGPGVVRSAGYIDGYGLTVVIDHPDGRATLYAHQSRVDVEAGAGVSAGQVIGAVGRTGSTTVDHLHLEIHTADGHAINPLPLMPPVARRR